MRRLNSASEELIKSFEELRLVAYDDAQPNRKLQYGDVVKGTLTIGWGHTGSDVLIGQAIDPERAEQLFRVDLAETMATVNQAVHVPLTDNQFGGLVSFAFNVGDDAFLGSTLLRVLNAGHYDHVPRELQKWTKTTVNGKKISSRGLTRRRAAEVNLWSAVGDPQVMTDSERGNQVAEPPPAKPVVTDAVVTGGVVAGAGAFLSDVAHQIEPLVPYGDTMKWLFLGLSLAAIGFVLFARIKAIRHEAS